MNTSEKIYPFKFLDSYTEADKDIFFGRDEEIKQLYDMLFQSDLLLVYGASGTGKTSLIQCGLANQFNAFDWFPIPIRRKSNINDSLEQALTDIAGKDKNLEVDDDFENIFSEGEEDASDMEQTLKKIYRKHFRPIYLIFDQFEELYVLGAKEEQQKFVQTVKAIMQIEQPIKILLSIREEYLGYLYEFEKAVPELLRKKLRIEAMNLDKVRQVLEGIDKNEKTIVSLAGSEQEKQDFTEQLFKKIQGEDKGLFIQLPYLQVFLDKLYRQITQDNTFQKEAEFSLEALQKIGDIGNVLRDFLEEQVIRIARKLKEEDKNLWKILSPFATLEGTKEPLSEAMLKEKLKSPELQSLTTQAIQEFVNARILRYTEKDELYEVVHDTLAKQIASKRSDEEIAILEIERLIANQVAFGKDLFSKKQIDVILPYLDKLQLEAEEKQLIKDSQAEIKKQEQATKRRNRSIQIGVTVFVIFLLGLSAVAFLQSREANKQAEFAKGQTEIANQKTKDAEESLKKFEEEKQKRITKEVERLIQAADAYWGVEEKELAISTLQEALKLDEDNQKALDKLKEWEGK